MEIISLTGLFILLQFRVLPVVADSFFDQFIDPIDGKLDASQWLSGRTGFLPVPIIISDPAVGYGGGLAAAFFHDSKDSAADGLQTVSLSSIMRVDKWLAAAFSLFTDTTPGYACRTGYCQGA